MKNVYILFQQLTDQNTRNKQIKDDATKITIQNSKDANKFHTIN